MNVDCMIADLSDDKLNQIGNIVSFVVQLGCTGLRILIFLWSVFLEKFLYWWNYPIYLKYNSNSILFPTRSFKTHIPEYSQGTDPDFFLLVGLHCWVSGCEFSLNYKVSEFSKWLIRALLLHIASHKHVFKIYRYFYLQWNFN